MNNPDLRAATILRRVTAAFAVDHPESDYAQEDRKETPFWRGNPVYRRLMRLRTPSGDGWVKIWLEPLLARERDPDQRKEVAKLIADFEDAVASGRFDTEANRR